MFLIAFQVCECVTQVYVCFVFSLLTYIDTLVCGWVFLYLMRSCLALNVPAAAKEEWRIATNLSKGIILIHEKSNLIQRKFK